MVHKNTLWCQTLAPLSFFFFLSFSLSFFLLPVEPPGLAVTTLEHHSVRHLEESLPSRSLSSCWRRSSSWRASSWARSSSSSFFSCSANTHSLWHRHQHQPHTYTETHILKKLMSQHGLKCIEQNSKKQMKDKHMQFRIPIYSFHCYALFEVRVQLSACILRVMCQNWPSPLQERQQPVNFGRYSLICIQACAEKTIAHTKFLTVGEPKSISKGMKTTTAKWMQTLWVGYSCISITQSAKHQRNKLTIIKVKELNRQLFSRTAWWQQNGVVLIIASHQTQHLIKSEQREDALPYQHILQFSLPSFFMSFPTFPYLAFTYSFRQLFCLLPSPQSIPFFSTSPPFFYIWAAINIFQILQKGLKLSCKTHP